MKRADAASLRAARCAASVALAAAAMAAHAQQATIALRAQAEPRGVRYTLGEIADVRSEDAALQRALAATEVGLTPRIGRTQSVAREAIAARLERVHPRSRGRFDWSGADAVVLRGSAERIDAQSLERIAARTLLDALEQRGLRAEVQAVRSGGDLQVPGGARHIRARLPERWEPARRICVWLDIEIDGRGYRSVPMWFAMKAQRQVRIARASLAGGTPLRAEDFDVDWFDVATLASAPHDPNAELAGKRLRQPLEAGRPLLASAVEPRPAVLRNQPVDVQLTVGPIRLQTAGIALADAGVGQTVKVRNPASNEHFGALVVAEGTVRVEAR